MLLNQKPPMKGFKINLDSVNTYFDNKVLNYIELHKRLFISLCDKISQTATESRLGRNYQLYTYAFFIRYYNKCRTSLGKTPKKNFSYTFGKWFPSGKTIKNLMLLIVIDEEIENFFQFEHLSDEKQLSKLKNVTNCIEEHTNGGLEELQSRLDCEDTEYDNPYKFFDILLDVSKTK